MPDRVIWGSKRTTAGATPFEAEVHRDPDSGIWWVQSDDLPGLATEATSLQHLIDHIMSLAPALVVIIRMIFLKSAFLPLLSTRLA